MTRSRARTDTASGKNALLKGPIATALLLFALPTLGSSILQSANGSIDAMWIGQLLGEDALAATTNGNLVMFLLTAFVFGFGMAATILIGQMIGRGDLDAAREVVGTAVGTFTPVAILIAITGWTFSRELLGLLGTPEEVLSLAHNFLRGLFLGMPAILMLTMLMMALRGSGDSITPLLFMALAVVLDSVLNPVFILGLSWVPKMGIAGSAFATALANYLSLGAMLIYVYARDLPLRLRGRELRYLRPELRVLKLLLGKGVPIGVQMVVVSSSMLAMLRLVNAQGVETTAAFGATQQVWTYVQMPAMALGAAVSAMAAQNIGAGQWSRVGRITAMGIVFNLVLTGGLIVLVLSTDRQVLSLFLAGDGQTMVIAQHILKLGTWGFLAFGVSMVLFGTVRGNGQVVWPLIILFVSLYPIRIGLAYGARDWLGVDSLWWSFPISLTATMLMAIILYVHGGWRRPQGLNFDASTEEISVSNPTGIGGATVPSTMRSCLSRNGVTK